MNNDKSKLKWVNSERPKVNKKFFSLSAIFISALIMVCFSFLFNLLTLSLGISTFTFEYGKVSFTLVGFLILFIISNLIMFIGGWIAGYLGNKDNKKLRIGELYGLTAWCLSLIFAMVLSTNGTAFVSNANYVVESNLPPAKIMIKENDNNYTSLSPSSELFLTSQELTNYLNKLSFITFTLLATGAFFSALGGRKGMNYKPYPKK